jgi:DNA-binding XRE family transcriptional regulator
MHGKELRDLRRKYGLTQVELGNEFEIDDQTICNWESNNVPLSVVYSLIFERFFNDTERIAQIIAGRKERRIKTKSEMRRIAIQKG